MAYSSINTLLAVIVAIWVYSLMRSILIMLVGKPIFKSAAKGEKTAYYPVLNLFTMLEVCEINTFWGILLFVPVFNLVVLFMMSYKLGVVFNKGTIFKVGLVLMPLLFYTILAVTDKAYKVSDHDYFKQMDSARGESINLMTEDEVREQNLVNDFDNNVEVDSIFKSDIQMMEKAAPYRAAKIDLFASDKDKDKTNLIDDNPLAKIHNQEEKENKHDDVEMLDL